LRALAQIVRSVVGTNGLSDRVTTIETAVRNLETAAHELATITRSAPVEAKPADQPGPSVSPYLRLRST
jgi:hypothetical protein